MRVIGVAMHSIKSVQRELSSARIEHSLFPELPGKGTRRILIVASTAEFILAVKTSQAARKCEILVVDSIPQLEGFGLKTIGAVKLDLGLYARERLVLPSEIPWHKVDTTTAQFKIAVSQAKRYLK